MKRAKITRRQPEPHGSTGIVDFVRVRAVRFADSVRTMLVAFAGTGSSIEDDDVQEQVADAEHAQLGLVVRPKPDDSNRNSTLEAIALADGDDVIVLAFIDKALKALTDSDVAPGEAALTGACADNIDTMVKVGADGDVIIKLKSGRKVIIQGGNKPVAHEGSQTTGHTHTLSGTAGPYAISGVAQTATDTIAAGQGSSDVLVRDT